MLTILYKNSKLSVNEDNCINIEELIQHIIHKYDFQVNNPKIMFAGKILNNDVLLSNTDLNSLYYETRFIHE